jgi:vacuolar-type H+-ATPase subunit I/STV1
VVIYAYYAPEEKPEGAATPKEYIERVEKKRSEKQQAMKAENKETEAAKNAEQEEPGDDTR